MVSYRYQCSNSRRVSMRTSDEAVELVASILEPYTLSTLQIRIIRACWEGLTYQTLARQLHNSPDYIRQVGQGLWRLLSEALGRSVNKRNLQSVLQFYADATASQAPIHSQTLLSGKVGHTVEEDFTDRKSHYLGPLTSSRHHSFEEVIDVSRFYGREEELLTLKQWILTEQCRCVAVLGRGGIGKTSLVAQFAKEVAPAFDYVIWRSLINAPAFQDFLSNLLVVLSENEVYNTRMSLTEQISLLMTYLREKRCLIVIDNVQSILQGSETAGQFCQGFEGYNQLMRHVSDENHRSCLILASREKPRDLSSREGDQLPVRVLQIKGLPEKDGRRLLLDKGLDVSKDNLINSIVNQYAGNPLALKIVATTIQYLFEGDITNFISQGTLVYGDIWDILEQQFCRLTQLEQQIIDWLAIDRDWTPLPKLRKSLVPIVSQRELIDALESLQRRSLVESHLAHFTLLPAMVEYRTDKLVNQFYQDIDRCEVTALKYHPMIQSQTKDYIRDAQIRFIMDPVCRKLLARLGPEQLTSRIVGMLSRLRHLSSDQVGYACGNLINLLNHSSNDLSSHDFSGLYIRQACLRNSELSYSTLFGSHIIESVFRETFAVGTSLGYSMHNGMLVLGDAKGEIYVWADNTIDPLYRWKAHTSRVSSLTFSLDGDKLATGSYDGTIKIWDMHTRDCLGTLHPTQHIQSISFSPTGDRLVCGSWEGKIVLWDVSTHARIQEVSTTSQVLSVSFSADGSVIATGGREAVDIWDSNLEKRIWRCQENLGEVWSVAFDSQGYYLAAGSERIYLWEVGSYRCCHILSGHTLPVSTLAFHPGGQLLVSGSEDGTICFWDIQKGECQKTILAHQGWVWSLVFSLDEENDLLASVGDDQTLKVWDTLTGQCITSRHGFTMSLRTLSLHPYLSLLASGSENGTVHLWELGNEIHHQILSGHTHRVMSVAFSPSGNFLASGGGYEVKVWMVDKSGIGDLHRVLRYPSAHINALSFSPQGNVLAASYDNGKICFWDLETGRYRECLQSHLSGPVLELHFDPTGNSVISCGVDRTLRIWNVSSGHCIRTISDSGEMVLALAISSEGKLAGSTEHLVVRVWDSQLNQCLHILTGLTSESRAVTFNIEGDQIIAGDNEGAIMVWDVATGACITKFQAHSKMILGLAIDPNGHHFFSSSFEGEIKLWDSTTYQCLRCLKVPGPCEGMIISGVTGLTEGQRLNLLTLGASEDHFPSPPALPS